MHGYTLLRKSILAGFAQRHGIVAKETLRHSRESRFDSYSNGAHHFDVYPSFVERSLTQRDRAILLGEFSLSLIVVDCFLFVFFFFFFFFFYPFSTSVRTTKSENDRLSSGSLTSTWRNLRKTGAVQDKLSFTLKYSPSIVKCSNV